MVADVTPDDIEAVRATFWAYERALMADDVAALDALFLDSAATLRADATAVLVGHDAIGAFRAGRGGAPQRVVDRLHLSPVAAGVVVAVAETRRGDGTRGLQSQTWVRTAAGWRVASAHVSVEPPGAGPVWRLRGTPLLAGGDAGPLSGVRVAVKDLFAVAGFRTGGGNPTLLLAAKPAERSSGAVQALLDAGADVVGIAQTDELAYSLSGTNVHYGAPPNPAVPQGIPGGSSSGPASAVALGEADAGLGTDTAGSIRVPASYQGLYSLRPTHGAVSTSGLLPLAPRFDTVGWLTRDPGTLVAVGDVLLPPGEPAPPRTVLVPADLFALAEPAVAASCRAAATVLAERKGLRLEEIEPLAGDQLETWFAAFRTVQGWQAGRSHGAWVRAHPGALGGGVAERFAVAAAITAEQHAAAELVLDAAAQTLRARIPAYAVVVLPAASTTAPPLGQPAEAKAATRAGTLRLTCLASLAGLPALTVPARPAGEPPVGLCILGAAGSDRALLALA